MKQNKTKTKNKKQKQNIIQDVSVAGKCKFACMYIIYYLIGGQREITKILFSYSESH